MKIAIAGASGLIGMVLVSRLKEDGHHIVRLVRPPLEATEGRVLWDPQKMVLNPADLEGIEAVINLSGENIAALRWTEAKKQRIRESRVKGATLLAKTLSEMQNPPKILINASAIGFYGNRGAETLRETSEPGSGFLPDVCQEWEKALEPAVKRGVRVVKLRFGIVLSRAGGALARMWLPFKLGLGGVVGSGEHWMSWIAIDDSVEAIHFCLTHDAIQGPVNVVAPDAATNAEFTKTLGRVMHRPTVLPMPAFVVRGLFGEMGEALMLSSSVVSPDVLKTNGFSFRFPVLEPALEYLLK